MAQRAKPAGKISRGSCERCKADLGNTLDPYCWPCAQQLEQRVERDIEARRQERMEAVLRRQPVVVARTSVAEQEALIQDLLVKLHKVLSDMPGVR